MADVEQAVEAAALRAAEAGARQHCGSAAAGRGPVGGGAAAVLQGLLIQGERLGPVARLLGRQALVVGAGAALAQAHQALQPVGLLQLPIHLLHRRAGRARVGGSAATSRPHERCSRLRCSRRAAGPACLQV